MMHQLFWVGRHNIISMTETKSFMWDISSAEVRKVYQLRGLPDCSAPMTSNSILLSSFEQPGNSSVYQDVGMPSNAVHVLYCMAGHKVSAGEIPVPTQQDRASWNASASKEVRRKKRGGAQHLLYSGFCDVHVMYVYFYVNMI